MTSIFTINDSGKAAAKEREQSETKKYLTHHGKARCIRPWSTLGLLRQKSKRDAKPNGTAGDKMSIVRAGGRTARTQGSG